MYVYTIESKLLSIKNFFNVTDCQYILYYRINLWHAPSVFVEPIARDFLEFLAIGLDSLLLYVYVKAICY